MPPHLQFQVDSSSQALSGERYHWSVRPDRRCSPGGIATGHPCSPQPKKVTSWRASLIIARQHQTSRNSLCYRFRNLLTNGQQRLQVFILSFVCLHSLCNAVGWQHPPRKPRRGAGRLWTSPDTIQNIWCNMDMLTALQLDHYWRSFSRVSFLYIRGASRRGLGSVVRESYDGRGGRGSVTQVVGASYDGRAAVPSISHEGVTQKSCRVTATWSIIKVTEQSACFGHGGVTAFTERRVTGVLQPLIT